MKMVKSLLLGSAAGLVAIAGAQAADLPVKAKPAQYVKICSLYGAGFWYIPGTDTCIKLGGWVRSEYNFQSAGSFNPHKVNPFNRNFAENTIRVRAILTVDARAQTEYGTLRSYFVSGWNSTTAGNAVGTGNGPADALYVPRAFIQLAGFTVGKAQSFYDFYNTPAYSNTTNVWGADTGGGGQTVAAYTMQFGGGMSGTISLEDPVTRRAGLAEIGGPATAGAGYIGGPQWPDVVANLRLDQPWGSAQIMGALHQVAANYYFPAVVAAGYPGDEIGYAIGAGLKFNLGMIAPGDNFSIEADWAKGAIKYAGGGLGSFVITQGAFAGIGPAFDGVFVPGSAIELTEAWSVVAGFEHHWNPKLKTSLYGTYGEVNYNGTVFGFVGGVDNSWAYWQIGSRTVWSPVKNLDLSVDVMYNKLETAATAAGFVDMDWWQGMVRAQRNFYP